MILGKCEILDCVSSHFMSICTKIVDFTNISTCYAYYWVFYRNGYGLLDIFWEPNFTMPRFWNLRGRDFWRVRLASSRPDWLPTTPTSWTLLGSPCRNWPTPMVRWVPTGKHHCRSALRILGVTVSQ